MSTTPTFMSCPGHDLTIRTAIVPPDPNIRAELGDKTPRLAYSFRVHVIGARRSAGSTRQESSSVGVIKEKTRREKIPIGSLPPTLVTIATVWSGLRIDAARKEEQEGGGSIERVRHPGAIIVVTFHEEN
ncbi:hypothetical protein TNCV_2002151 [Trichonephila clavipes]|nr:hypothetical protein TNCV_2002151 [Trichonephila clavipes]